VKPGIKRNQTDIRQPFHRSHVRPDEPDRLDRGCRATLGFMVVSAGATAEQLLAQASQLRRTGRVAEAIAAYERLVALKPDLPDSWYNLAWLQRQARRFEAALASYQQALDRGVSQPEEVHLNRAVILSDHLARSDEAEAELATALSLNPSYVPALLNLGNINEDRGNRAGACESYERALVVDPGNMLALARLAGVAEIKTKDDPLIRRLRNAISSPTATDEDRADLGFSLGRVLDAAGEYDDAFAACAAANESSRAAFGHAQTRYDREASERLIDRLIAAFPTPVTAPAEIETPSPIFICGMFRSGSTLAEQILASHSQVTPGGELDLLPALIAEELQPYPEAMAGIDQARVAQLRAAYLSGVRSMHPEARFVTDKRPDNFLHIGLIRTLFPRARIIHTRRNPLDNCLSVYFLHLDPSMAYAFDLLDSAHWYRQHCRLMAHWKSLYPDDIFELDYDALVSDPKPSVAALLEFCGLPWEGECLDFHTATNPVKTASAWQVREPLYRRASGRWRHYEHHLASLREALET
jgi:tetratricopeptide (TPR) repeat protein